MLDDKKDGSLSDDEAIHKEALEDIKLCAAAEKDNREAALDDLKFARLGEQWHESDRAKRELDGRPCMTFNRMPTFIRQVVNDGRQNKPAIKVHPADDKADPKTAEVINGLIRNIEYSSNADVAYDTGLDAAASGGFGYWRVGVEYSHDDTFDMDIQIQPIHNQFSVYGDWASVEADSAEWNRAFVMDAIEKDVFEKKYKGKDKVDWEGEGYKNMPSEWMDGEKIIVAEYWRRKEVIRTLLLLSDGRAVRKEWFDAKIDGVEEIYPEAVGLTNGAMLQQQGITIKDERETRSYKVCQYILNGVEVLETNEWAGKYIPIVPVYGEMINVEGKRHLKSLIRDAKDAQRNFNYWRTATTEQVALANKMPVVGAVGQFDTDAEKWARANTDSMPYIEYDVVEGASAPMRQPFAGVPAGALQEALNASDDMKTITGIHDASLGAQSNETSGRAINARKSESDTGTFHFIDNQARAIRHTGRIIIDLIPATYNKPRIARVMGIDKKPQNVPINQPLQPGQQLQQGKPQNQPQQGAPNDEDGIAQIYDLTVGKYDLTVDVGPSFQTKREEAAYGMTELLRALPQAAPVIAPRLAKAQDWPDADEIAEELEALGPGAGKNPAVQQAQQQIQELSQKLQQAQQQLQGMQQDRSIEEHKAQIDEFNAKTNRIKALASTPQPQTPEAPAAPELSEADRILLEGKIKMELQTMIIKGNERLEMLKQGVIATPEQQQANAEFAAVMQQIMGQMMHMQKLISAPRKKTLVRDPATGKAVHAVDEIMLSDEPEQGPSGPFSIPGEEDQTGQEQ